VADAPDETAFHLAPVACKNVRMTFQQLVKPAVLTQPVYEPGKPIEDVARELGLDPESIIKLASNENPFGPSPRAVTAATHALAQGGLYPDGGCFVLRQKLAAARGLAPEQLVIGNGSNEIIELLGHALLGPGDEVVMATPSFVVYKLVTLLFGAKPVEVPLRDHRHDLDALAAAITPRTKLVFVCSPNNPTGTANTEAELLAFGRALPDHVVGVFDEAYAEYVERAPDLRPLIAEGRNVVCLRTFSKIYGLAGLRIGYGYAAAQTAALLNRVRQPFNVNAIAQAAAIAALEDEAFAQRCAAENRSGLRQLEDGFRRLGLEWVPSAANFILVRVGDGAAVFDALQRRGVIVRPVKSYGLPEWVRVTVGTGRENERLLAELAHALGGAKAGA
jgi:histidinol-phosphate aminotransferase